MHGVNQRYLISKTSICNQVPKIWLSSLLEFDYSLMLLIIYVIPIWFILFLLGLVIYGLNVIFAYTTGIYQFLFQHSDQSWKFSGG